MNKGKRFKSITKNQLLGKYEVEQEDDPHTRELLQAITDNKKFWAVPLKELPKDVREELLDEYMGAPVYVGDDHKLSKAYQFDMESGTGFIYCPVGKPSKGIAVFTVGSNTFVILMRAGLLC